MSAPKVLLAAVEPSADAIGASLIAEIRRLSPEVRFVGCGGPLMAREGFQSLFDIAPLSVIGFLDVLRAAPAAYRFADALAEAALRERPDIAVLIDGWAFSRLLAVRLRKLPPGTTLVKLVAPQVWASRAGRVKFVKDHFDAVLCLLPFEPPYFARAGVRAEFIGNPNFQAAWRSRGDGAAFRARHRLGDAPLLAVLLGSRKAEVARLAAPFGDAVKILAERVPGLRVASPVAPSVERHARARLARFAGDPVIVGADEKYDALAAANVGLTASGTASTELAINRTPMVVGYRLDPISAIWARSVLKIPYVSIINVAGGRFVIPELLQEDCTGPNIAGALLPLFADPEAYAEQGSAFATILKSLGVDGAPAAEIAAERILEWAAMGKDRLRASRLPSSGPAS
ncbi:MAG TPA: lipid-A-disaccharide synthase [Parvularcula sp.]|nr:lipid-A-disaccharide synthase [Parvularcula sp.]HBS33490.1 lipid-A-disaccharide synthase [Parvularcula sp.]